MRKVMVLFLFILSAFLFTTAVDAHATLSDCTSNTCTISAGNLYTAGIDVAGEHDYFNFTPITSGYYVIETYGTLDTYMQRMIYYGTYVTNDDGGEKRNANMGFYGVAGTTYQFDVRAYSSYSTGDYFVQVRHQHASIFTFDYGSGDIDTTPDAVTAIAELGTLGYTAWDHQNSSETTIKGDDYTGLSRLNKEVVFYAGHGSEGSVLVSNYNHSTSTMYSSELPYMGNVKLVVWATCYSSSGTSSLESMAEQSVLNGANSAIGWPEAGNDASYSKFTDNLFVRLSDGYSVSDSASYAASKLRWPWDVVKDYEIFGSSTGNVYASVNDKQNSTSYVPLYSYPDPPWYYSTLDIDELESLEVSNNQYSLESTIVNLGYTENDEEVFREYTYINGILLGSYKDVTISGKTLNYNDEQLVIGKIDFDMFALFQNSKHIDFYAYTNYITNIHSTHNAIISYEGETIAIEVVYLYHTNIDNGHVFSTAKIFNIDNGNEIDYSSVSFLD